MVITIIKNIFFKFLEFIHKVCPIEILQKDCGKISFDF
jgi:hypothetical protein